MNQTTRGAPAVAGAFGAKGVLGGHRHDLPIQLASGYSQAAERMGEECPILTKPYQLADLNRALGAAVARLETV